MGLKNSELILCKNIRLEKDYKDVLSYSESQMVTLCRSKAVASTTDYTFIRPDLNELKVNYPYGTCLQCNYMAFQNPNYANKWFFAFIDEVKYLSDNSTKISYTIDEFATWYDYWDVEPCFVLREHVSDDSIGANTYPEGLEFGDYVINSTGDVETDLSANEYAIIGVSWIPDNSDFVQAVRIYGGVYSGLTYFCFRTFDSASNFIKGYTKAGHLNDIINMFMLPQVLTTLPQTGNMWIDANLESVSMTFAILPNTAGVVVLRNADISLTSPTSLNGYVPKNNKLFVAPYNMLCITNNAGVQAEYHYEDFINNSPLFSLVGVPSPSGSVWLFPNNYKKSDATKAGYNWGIPGAKYPQGSWQGDQYTNWMTQNGINLFGHRIDAPTAHAIGGSLQMVTSALTRQYDGIGAGLGEMLGATQEMYRASMMPSTIGGQINSGDVTYAYDKMSPTYYKMTIKAEYAKIIDDWFSKFGYKVNKIKMPNQISRSNWNFIQIGRTENIGYSINEAISTPAKSMEIINNIYRNGVTVWHNHETLGDYSQTNNIV